LLQQERCVAVLVLKGTSANGVIFRDSPNLEHVSYDI